MHATSKPQSLGLLLVLAGVSLAAGSWSLAAFMLVVLMGQMATVTVSSAMVGRAAFRRGFVRGGDYAIDELSPRLAGPSDDDDDEDGFVDSAEDDDHEGMAADGQERFPENVVTAQETAGAVTDRNWSEPEAGGLEEDTDTIDVDLEDETELEAEEVAERDRRS